MCWQLTLSVSQIVAAVINKGVASNGTRLAYRLPIGFQLIFPALVIALVWFVPESPRWLLRNGRDQKAEAALLRIHGEDRSYDPQSDLTQIQEGLREEADLAAESSWMSLVTDPIERRKLIFSAGALVAQQINGIQCMHEIVPHHFAFVVVVLTNFDRVLLFWHSLLQGHRAGRSVLDDDNCLHYSSRHSVRGCTMRQQDPKEAFAALDHLDDDYFHFHSRRSRHTGRGCQSNIRQGHHFFRDY